MSDGERLLAQAREIAFPRYPGTEGNRRARRIVVRRFNEAGLSVVVEDFSYDIRVAFRAIRAVLIVAALQLAAAGVVAVWSNGLSLALLFAGLIVGGLILVWTPGAEKLYSGPGPTHTANVTGYRRTDRPRLTLIFMAHYDSKSQNLTFPWRMGMTLTAILGAGSLAAVLVLRAFAVSGVGPVWLPASLGGLAATALLVLSTLRSGNESPGGVDNAGSLAILFELARELPRRAPDDVELIFVSPSAEEDHMVGAMRWLDAHRDELRDRPVLALNFDGAGSPGRAVLLERYGLGRRFSPTLAPIAHGLARELRIPLRRVWLPPAVGIDAIPFHHRGLECLTLSSGSPGRATMAIHSAGDVADNLDPGTLASVARLALALGERISRSGHLGASTPGVPHAGSRPGED
jgi:hypothetical protein